MSRLLLAGLFIFSLTVWTGCEASGGPATKGEAAKGDASKVSGMTDSAEGEGGLKDGQLPPPPKLSIPDDAK